MRKTPAYLAAALSILAGCSSTPRRETGFNGPTSDSSLIQDVNGDRNPDLLMYRCEHDIFEPRHSVKIYLGDYGEFQEEPVLRGRDPAHPQGTDQLFKTGDLERKVGTKTPHDNLSWTGELYGDIALVDEDKDGKKDFIFWSYDRDKQTATYLIIAYGNGDGTFKAAQRCRIEKELTSELKRELGF